MIMKILFVTIAWPNDNGSNLYTDHMQEFQMAGHEVYVVATCERREGKKTYIAERNGMHVLRVRCGNMQKTNKLEKAISSVLLGYQMRRAINQYFSGIQFDLIICSTPPVTLANTIKILKKKYKASLYLLLKDIWPQAVVDMGAMQTGGLVWKYFKYQEKTMYLLADFIGCMSLANVRYVLKHNPEVAKEKVEVCPNCITPFKDLKQGREELRDKYGIPQDSVVFLFGGNLGIPQGLSFLLDVIEEVRNRQDVYFIIVGSGTEFTRLESRMSVIKPKNAAIYKGLPRLDYDKLLSACDVGLILLDQRYTVPNFPSKLVSYLNSSLPILCATDSATDIGDIVFEAGCGLKTLHGDVKGFINAVNILAGDPKLRREMGMKALELLETQYTARIAYETIIKHYEGRDKVNA